MQFEGGGHRVGMPRLRRFPLCHLLPLWSLSGWLGGVAIDGELLKQVIYPEYIPSHAEGIEWPLHNRGFCFGDVREMYMLPLQPDTSKRLAARLPYMSPAELEKALPWRTATFTGKPVADFIELEIAENYLRALVADTGRLDGVRVRFGSRVSYSCFFEVLYRAWAIGQQKYWLDVRHTPMTLYFVNLPKKNRSLNY